MKDKRGRYTKKEIETIKKSILDFIISYKEENGGMPPTIREMLNECRFVIEGNGRMFSFSSTSQVSYWLDKLTNSGMITRKKNASRVMYVTGEETYNVNKEDVHG
jgi:SOS-response transcriptional repressor LexA